MAAPSNKSVKVLADLVTKKQIIKKDGNTELFVVSGTLAAGHVSSSLPLTASSVYTPELNISASSNFRSQNVQDLVVDSRYNVDGVLHKLEDALYNVGALDAVRAKEAENAYKRLRYQKTGAFNAEGYAEFKLPANYAQYDYPTLVGSPDANGFATAPVFENGVGTIDAGGELDDPNYQSFPVSSKDYILLDVMVKDADDTEATWCNDILAVNLVVSGTAGATDELWVRMWAPDLAGSDDTVIKYRVLAVNEDPSMYIIK